MTHDHRCGNCRRLFRCNFPDSADFPCALYCIAWPDLRCEACRQGLPVPTIPPKKKRRIT